MSTNSLYLVPNHEFAAGEFKSRLVKSLKDQDLVEWNGQEDDHYPAGKDRGFEYAIVHDSPYLKLVPAFIPGSYGSLCPKCRLDSDDPLYDAINDYYDFEEETGKEKDMTQLAIVCPHCKTNTTLGELIYPEQVLFTKQYIKFVNIAGELPGQLLAQIEEAIGTAVTRIPAN